MAPVLQGLGTALILAIVEQVRDRDEQTRAAASAEARALQARMNPHFLFNALNALAALSRVAPREVPRATGLLRQFLRASFDQEERVLVPLEEELAVVRAYLEIESLRFGSRLKVEQTTEVEQLFFAERPRVHALVLLRRRLQGLFGHSFQLEVRSEIGDGTTVTMRIPLRKRFGVDLEAPRAVTSDLRELAPN